MREKSWFNLVFMLICTSFFTAILSGAYVYTRPRIQANYRLTVLRAHFNAFDIAIPVFSEPTEFERHYEQKVERKVINDFEVLYLQDEAGETISIGFPFTGSGLWGTIAGMLALTPDLTTVVGIDFTEQNETPGLGGRIEEEWFLEQFRGAELFETGRPLRFDSSAEDGQVDAITGATSTSVAVINILNDIILEAREIIGGGN